MTTGAMPWEMDWSAQGTSPPPTANNSSDESAPPWEMDWSPKQTAPPEDLSAETSSPYAKDMPLPRPPSTLERVENALGAGPRITTAAVKGFGEGFQPEEPLENLPESAEKALGAIGLAPSKNNVNLFNQTADQLANLGYRGFELAGRVFEGVIHGLGRGGQQALIEAGVEPQAAADIARDVAGGAEIELSRGGEIPMHGAAGLAREFAPENVLRQPVQIPPEQAAASSPVMQAGNLDDAIKAADQASQGEPYDIEAEAAKADMLAKAGEQQAIIPPHDTLADILGEEPGAPPAVARPEETAAPEPEIAPENAAEAATAPEIPVATLGGAARDIREWNSPPPKDQTLFDWIKRRGGIKVRRASGDYSPEGSVVAQILDKTGYPGLVNNARGITPDYLREAMQEDGWFQPNKGEDLQDFYDLLDQQARGNPVYRADSDIQGELQRRADLDEEMSRAVVSQNDPMDVQVRTLAQFRHERDLSAQNQAQTADQFTELRTRADQLGVPHHADMTYDELLGDVAEREAIQGESNDVTADQLEQRIGDTVAARTAPEGAGAEPNAVGQPDETGIPGWDFEPGENARAEQPRPGTEGGGETPPAALGTGPKFAIRSGDESEGVAAPRFALAYHGSPYDFDRFSNEAIGSGEGAQAYGWGHYFAGKKEVAEFYRDKLSRDRYPTDEELAEYFKPGNIVHGYGGMDKVVAFHPETYGPGGKSWSVDVYGVDRNGNRLPGPDGHLRNHSTKPSSDEFKRVTGKPLTGKLYQVNLTPKDDEYLDWDKPLNEQTEKAKAALAAAGIDLRADITGGNLYNQLSRQWDSKEAASSDLRQNGIAGIRYLDQGSRDIADQLETMRRAVEHWRLVGDADKLAKAERSVATLERHDAARSYNYVVFDPSHIDVQAKFAQRKPLTDVGARQGWTPKSEVTPEGTRLIYRPEFEARSAQLADSLKAELGKIGLSKIGVRVADEIRRPGGEVRANAYYWQRMITMALDTKNPLSILNHEVVHGLKDMGLFTPGEWRILEAEARRKWMNDPEISERLKLYPDVSNDARLEEAVAMAAERGPAAQPSPFAARIFSRMRDFFRALGNALRGNGFATPDSIFRDIREGKFGERLNAREGEEGPKFARRPEDESLLFGEGRKPPVPWKVEIRQIPRLTSYGRTGRRTPQAVLLDHGNILRAIGEPVESEIARFQRIADRENATRGLSARAKEQPPEPTTEPGATDAHGKPLPQLVIPGAERSARQAAASRETGTGKIAPKAPQKEADGLFATEAEKQADLFSDKPRFALRDEDEQIHDSVSGLVAAATGGDGRGPSVTERDLPKLAQAGIRQIKNLTGVTLEAETIFPRTLARLDDMSARLWNAWTKKTEKGNANLDTLRRIVSDSLGRLPAESRNRVYSALELAVKFNWRPADDGRAIRVRNTSYWQAQKSKVGDNYVLNPAETKAFHDTLKLGDEGWRMIMTAMARREGWKGDPDPEAIRASVAGQEGLPEGKRLLRLADALDHAKLAMNRPYFPASRFGDYFIAVRPKLTTDEESLGGFPEVQRFETVEKPIGDDLLGRGRKAANDLPAVKDAITRIRSMTKPDGSLAFPEGTHTIETGDLRARPDILRKLNIPAVEKLFSLMERGVTQELTDRIMNEGVEKPEAVAGAKEAYTRLAGEAKDTLLDALYHDLLAGFKKQANLVPGYSADFDRAISSHSGHIARNAAEMEHREEIEAAYQNIQDNHPHQSVKDYWRHWRDYQDSPRASLMGPVGSLSRIGATYVMGLNPSTTIMISAHTPMMAVPVLSVGGSVGRTSLEMTRALKEAYGAIQFDADKGASIDITKLGQTDRERALIADAGKSGLLHAMGADDVRAINDRQAGLWGKMAPTMRKALDISMSNISVVDQANRSAIALVAHRMASDPATLQKLAAPWIEHNSVFRDMVQREGLSPESFAKFMLSEAGGAWGRMNQSAVMRGPEGSLVFALHGFQTRYLSTMFNLVKNMGPEGKVAVGWMAAALWFAAGTYGLPFTQDMENAGDLLWKKITGEDPMIDAHVRQFLSDVGFGKIGTEVMLRGPLSILLGIDLSSRIGFGDIITRVVGLGDFMGTIPTIMLGRLTNAYERERSGQGVGSAAAELLPSALRNPARAAIESGQGAESAKGRMEVPAANLSGGDAARQAMGLPPLTVEQAFARNEDLSRLSQRDQDLHEQTVASAANLILQSENATKAGDAETARSLSGKLSALLGDYNRNHWQMPVTGQELSNAILQLTNPDLYRRIRLPHAVQGEAQNRPYP